MSFPKRELSRSTGASKSIKALLLDGEESTAGRPERDASAKDRTPTAV